LQEISLKQQRSKQEHMYDTTTDEQRLKRDLMSFNEQEKVRRARKIEQQQRLRAELDTIIERRKEAEMEKQHKINMVEFSMNKKSLKDLGIVDKKTLEEYYEKN